MTEGYERDREPAGLAERLAPTDDRRAREPDAEGWAERRRILKHDDLTVIFPDGSSIMGHVTDVDHHNDVSDVTFLLREPNKFRIINECEIEVHRTGGECRVCVDAIADGRLKLPSEDRASDQAQPTSTINTIIAELRRQWGGSNGARLVHIDESDPSAAEIKGQVDLVALAIAINKNEIERRSLQYEEERGRTKRTKDGALSEAKQIERVEILKHDDVAIRFKNGKFVTGHVVDARHEAGAFSTIAIAGSLVEFCVDDTCEVLLFQRPDAPICVLCYEKPTAQKPFAESMNRSRDRTLATINAIAAELRRQRELHGGSRFVHIDDKDPTRATIDGDVDLAALASAIVSEAIRDLGNGAEAKSQREDLSDAKVAKAKEYLHETQKKRRSVVRAEDWYPTVAQSFYDKDGAVFEAKLPFRGVTGEGPSEKAAIGNLIALYCELSRIGDINPSDPHAVGNPTLQHVIELLTERLDHYIRLRREDWKENVLSEENVARARENNTTGGGAWLDSAQFKRRNEVIAGIATALAALARVREL